MATINFTTTDTTFTMEVNGINYGTWDKVQQVDGIYGITNGGNMIGITLQNPFKSYGIKLGDEVNINGEEVTDALPVLAETIKDEVLYLPSASTVVAVYQLKTVLTDAQIKALPTTPFDLLPALGADQIYQIVGVSIISQITSPYTNINGTGSYMVPVFEGDTEFTNYMIETEISNFLSDNNFAYYLPKGNVNSYGGAPIILWLPDVLEKKFQLYFENNSAGNLTGGHASNSLIVTVFYSIVDL